MIEVADDAKWHCDLVQIDGLSASKSPLEDFQDLDELVLAAYPSLVQDVSLAALEANFAHQEIRIGKGGGEDFFQVRAWDGRIFVINNGGSHHLAAARYIAKRLPVEKSLVDRRIEYRFVPAAVASLNSKFSILLVNLFADSDGSFHAAMEAMRASYYQYSMPRGFGEVQAIFLPMTEAGSQRAAKILRSAGCTDIGRHLLVLCNKQDRHWLKLQGG